AAGGGRDAVAELLAQVPRAPLLDRADAKIAELERAERDADQPRHLEAEMLQHVLDLAVLALADRKREPHVRTLRAVERGFDRAVADAADGHAVAQCIEPILRDAAMGAHAVAAEPPGLRELEHACEP